MKTIVIQLLESMVLSEDEYNKMIDSGHYLDDYAPEGVYNYYKLGKRKIMAVLNSELLTSALIPMLKEFYSVYGDKKYSQQYNAVLRELNKLEKISYERCEHLSYDNEEAFYPVFINNPNLKPFLMYEDGVKADCTGIVLCAILPEIATFSMLYTLEQEIQNKLSGHNLGKALKVCIDDYMQ